MLCGITQFSNMHRTEAVSVMGHELSKGVSSTRLVWTSSTRLVQEVTCVWPVCLQFMHYPDTVIQCYSTVNYLFCSHILCNKQEEESTEGGDGVLDYTRLFECAPHKSYFTGLHNISKDSRFTESSLFIHRNPNLSQYTAVFTCYTLLYSKLAFC